jgi:hypothetical protein
MLLDFQKFGGTAPKILDPALLGDKSQVAQNVRFDQGGIAPLLTDLLIQATGTTDTIVSIITYFLTTDAITYFLQWDSDVDAVRVPIGSDIYNRVFYTEGGVFKATDKDLFKLGGTAYPMDYYLPCPPAPIDAIVAVPTVVGSDPTLLETRGYVYTYVNSYGEEGPPSPVSNLFDIYDGNTCDLSGMDTDAGLDARYKITLKRIYRINMTASGTAQYQFVVEIAVATTTYSDTKDNAELGEILATAEWEAPPSGITGIINLPNGMLAGIVPDNNLVCFSVPFYPHAWPASYQKATERKPVGLGAFGNTVIALTQGQPYAIIGNDPANLVSEKIDIDYSCMSKRGIVNMGSTIVYPAPQGLVGINPQGATLLTAEILTSVQWQALYNPSSITAFQWEDKYIAFYYHLQNLIPVFWAGFIFDLKTKDLIDLDFFADAGYFDPSTGILYLVISGDIVAFNVGGGTALEGGPVMSLNFIGILTTDPDTSGWDSTQEGYWWYNKTDHHMKYWNSTEIVLM